MFKKILKYIKFKRFLKAEQKSASQNMSYFDDSYVLHKPLEDNISNLKKLLGHSDDIIFREFYFGVKQNRKAFVCFIDGLGDKKLINEYIVKSLMVNSHVIDPENKIAEKHDMFNYLKEYILNIVESDDVNNFNEAVDAILSGDTLLLIDGIDKGFSISAKGGEKRSIEAPETEVVIRGSRESFVETLRVNTSMLRRIIKNINLVFEPFTAGKQTRTNISIAYIKGIANEKIIEEVRNRLNRIDIDSILESGYIEQLIEDNPLSPFSTVGNSERPDKVAAKLLEGRVAIFCDGTPVVLTVPYLFIESLQVSEDYYSRPFLTTVIRMLRVIALVITLTLSALYVALATFHQEMVPTVLLVSIAASREGTPFPLFLETLLSETIFQLLRESGIRMPRAVGQAVSIVGTLVIGEAAVTAGIIGAPMVIITSLSAICSFIIPSIYDVIFIFKFMLIFLSGAFGLFGVTVGLLCILGHMCSLRSFGTPYMAPFAPTIWKDLKDSIVRFPLWLLKSRPKSIDGDSSKRQSEAQMPGSPDKKRGGKVN